MATSGVVIREVQASPHRRGPWGREEVLALTLSLASKTAWLACLYHLLRRAPVSRRRKAAWATFMFTLPVVGCTNYVFAVMGLNPIPAMRIVTPSDTASAT